MLTKLLKSSSFAIGGLLFITVLSLVIVQEIVYENSNEPFIEFEEPDRHPDNNIYSISVGDRNGNGNYDYFTCKILNGETYPKKVIKCLIIIGDNSTEWSITSQLLPPDSKLYQVEASTDNPSHEIASGYARLEIITQVFNGNSNDTSTYSRNYFFEAITYTKFNLRVSTSVNLSIEKRFALVDRSTVPYAEDIHFSQVKIHSTNSKTIPFSVFDDNSNGIWDVGEKIGLSCELVTTLNCDYELWLSNIELINSVEPMIDPVIRININGSDYYSANLQELDDEGYIRNWLLLGPFPSDKYQRNFSSIDFLDYYSNSTYTEKTIIPISGQQLPSRYSHQYIWVNHQNEEKFVDLSEYYSELDYNYEHVGTYAYVNLISDRDMIIEMRIGSDDGIYIQLNSNDVFNYPVYRGYDSDDDLIIVNLKEGLNRLLVKVDNGWGGYKFSINIRSGGYGRIMTLNLVEENILELDNPLTIIVTPL